MELRRDHVLPPLRCSSLLRQDGRGGASTGEEGALQLLVTAFSPISMDFSSLFMRSFSRSTASKSHFQGLFSGVRCLLGLEGGIWASVSEPAKRLIALCLELDPAKRISCEEALKQPWFQGTISRGCFDGKVLGNLRSFSVKTLGDEASCRKMR